MNKDYQICTRCVMDTSATDIFFDEQGVCNYCTEFLQRSGHILLKNPVVRSRDLNAFIDRVKRDGRGKRYDCIIGVSGGVDSSWVLVQAVKLGLRPLAVHMDNGWNSELAQNNIANLVRGLGVDLYTHVIDWNEYKQLMQAFFDAHVIDVELLYDNAMLAVNYQQASKYRIKYILSGSNQTSEGMRMPKDWNWLKFDKKHIKALGRRGGVARLETFPSIGTLQFIWYEFVRQIHWTPFLDYLEYEKNLAIDVLEKDYEYKPYPYKHYESIFTRFYQGYILPNKFQIDKRKLHFSTLIISGQLERNAALADLDRIPYPNTKVLEDDKKYFIKKLGWSPERLQEYITAHSVSHSVFETERDLWHFCLKIYKNCHAYFSLKKR
jgi:N-acetyl sugar amidotransferase